MYTSSAKLKIYTPTARKNSPMYPHVPGTSPKINHEGISTTIGCVAEIGVMRETSPYLSALTMPKRMTTLRTTAATSGHKKPCGKVSQLSILGGVKRTDTTRSNAPLPI